MKFLSDIAKAISDGTSKEHLRAMGRENSEQIAQELINLSNEDISFFVEQLFGQEIKSDESLYDVLTDLQRCVGYESQSYSFIGRVWAKAFNSLEDSRQRELLLALLSNKRSGFWTAIRCFGEFCNHAMLPIHHTADWFASIAERIAGDMAGGEFYVGIANYARVFPKLAFHTFEEYISKDLNPVRIHISAILLGTLRSKELSTKLDPLSVDKWDRRLQKSSELNWRLIYHKSLVSSYNMGDFSITQLRSKLSKMLKASQEEVSEAFDIVGRCLRKDKIDVNFLQFALRWYKENVSLDLPDYAKYHLVESLWLLCSLNDLSNKTSVISQANSLIESIQPIPKEHRGTWDSIERYLVCILEYDWDLFEELFTNLLELAPDEMLKLFREEGYLKSELAQSESEKLVTKLLLSANRKQWEIGKVIFQETNIDTLSHEVLTKANEIQLEIALLQFIRSPFLERKTCRYLTELEPYFVNAHPELQEDFKNELTLQAINYPQACLAVWEKLKPASNLMQDAVQKAQLYFDKLSGIDNCPARSFCFPGFANACLKANQIFYRKVMREAKEKSVFARFVRNFEIIYGNQWATFIHDKLSSTSPFTEHSHSMEFPRLEVIDSEGMALRRLHASARIRELKD